MKLKIAQIIKHEGIYNSELTGQFVLLVASVPHLIRGWAILKYPKRRFCYPPSIINAKSKGLFFVAGDT